MKIRASNLRRRDAPRSWIDHEEYSNASLIPCALLSRASLGSSVCGCIGKQRVSNDIGKKCANIN